MGGVEGREERTGKKAIVFGMSYYNRTLNCCVCIVNNLFMNNTISNLKWDGLYAQGCGVRYMAFGSFPRQPHASCGTSEKNRKIPLYWNFF